MLDTIIPEVLSLWKTVKKQKLPVKHIFVLLFVQLFYVSCLEIVYSPLHYDKFVVYLNSLNMNLNKMEPQNSLLNQHSTVVVNLKHRNFSVTTASDIINRDRSVNGRMMSRFVCFRSIIQIVNPVRDR